MCSMLNKTFAVQLNDVEGLKHVVLLYDLLCLHQERCAQALVQPN